MLDSSSRLPDWEEATFTRPMRSPFAADPPADVDVKLEEAALFEAPRRPPPLRKSVLPAPLTDEECTSRNAVDPQLLRALRDMRDSTRLMQAAIDLGKTVEEPVFAGEVLLESSAIRSRK